MNICISWSSRILGLTPSLLLSSFWQQRIVGRFPPQEHLPQALSTSLVSGWETKHWSIETWNNYSWFRNFPFKVNKFQCNSVKKEINTEYSPPLFSKERGRRSNTTILFPWRGRKADGEGGGGSLTIKSHMTSSKPFQANWYLICVYLLYG